ncbi:MAG: SPFH domain-containing protein, partial [Bacteroidota bacterium]|nr:SPFH domain-containing protein [Bacteroidota bacterium]
MGLWDKVKGELIDIIEWIDESSDTLVFRFERYGNEIKNGAKLVVRESQVAVFINEGELADVFPPGTYTLETQNLPILSTLKGWKHGFKSPYKAEVYFVSTRLNKNNKWGTPNAFYIRDQDFGRVSLRAFGTYTFKVGDAAKFIKNVSGTEGEFTTDEVSGELRSLIVTRFIDAVGESKLSLLDFASNYKDLSDFCQKKLQEEFVDYGLKVQKFLISSINLPEELQKKLDMGTGLNMVGDMDKYQQMKMADAMEAA